MNLNYNIHLFILSTLCKIRSYFFLNLIGITYMYMYVPTYIDIVILSYNIVKDLLTSLSTVLNYVLMLYRINEVMANGNLALCY